MPINNTVKLVVTYKLRKYQICSQNCEDSELNLYKMQDSELIGP